MDLDELLLFYFGTTEPEALDDRAIGDGIDRAAIAFGTERDQGRRFALWALLEAFGQAPEPAVAFENERDRRAAEDYVWAAARIDRGTEQ